MTFTTDQRGPVTVIHLDGNLMGGPDASTLNEQLNALVDAGKTSVVIDLGGVQFMNSSGLGLLIGGVTALKNAGGALKIAAASQKIAELFRITRLTSFLENHPTVDAAVASFTA